VFLYILFMIIINLKQNESRTSVIMKILTNYIQTIGGALAFNISWPDGITKLYYPFKILFGVSSSMFNFDCFLKQHKSTIELPFLKFLIFQLSPLIFILFLSVFWGLLHIICKLRFKISIIRYFIVSMVVFLFFVHPSLT